MLVLTLTKELEYMRKWIILVFALICVLGLCACNSKKDVIFDDTEVFFVGKVVEVYDNYLLVEVTDKGNSSFSVGTSVEVSTNVTSADGCPNIITGEYIRIGYNGVVLEKIPPVLGEVFRIDKTNETGLSTAD